MSFKLFVSVIILFISSIDVLIVNGTPKSKGALEKDIPVAPSSASGSLLSEFSKKFNQLLERCNEVEVAQNFCTEARTELLPLLNTILKSEVTFTQDPIQKVLGDGRNCLFRNRKYPEYFYAAGDWLTQVSHDERLALTWLPGWYDDECFWNLERVEGDSETQYRIKSKKYGEYLHGARNNWYGNSPEQRFVFTWKKHSNRCEEQCVWDLKMIKTDESKSYFVVKNVESREYLYAMNDLTYETNSRYVFTKKYEALKEIMDHFEMQWSIECK